jgi:hypothetical protein
VGRTGFGEGFLKVTVGGCDAREWHFQEIRFGGARRHWWLRRLFLPAEIADFR